MTAQNVTVPYEFFTGLDGKPLDAGYIYIGQENLDPETNPITVYWDDALSITAQQPIRTQLGFPVRAGSPSGVFAGSKYSITVKNSRSELVYTNLSGGDALRSDLADSIDSAKGDALVAVKQPYTGAIARTQHQKNAERLSITDFVGADPTGATDSTGAISAAIAATPAGATLDGAGGTYLTTGAVVNKSIIFQNCTLVLKDAAVANTWWGACVQVTANNVVLRDINTSITAAGLSNYRNASGILVGAPPNGTGVPTLQGGGTGVSNVTIEGGVQAGSKQTAADYTNLVLGAPILIYKGADCLVDRAYVNNAQAEGIYLWTCTTSSVRNCKAYNSAYSGITTDYGSGNIVRDCYVYNSTASGISINSTYTYTGGNTVVSSGLHGINLGHTGYPVIGCIVDGNTVELAGVSLVANSASINLQIAERVTVSNNTLKATKDNSGSGFYCHGIQVANNPVSAKILNNNMTLQRGYGIKVVDSSATSTIEIYGNTVDQSWYDGVVVTGTKRVYVRNNIITQSNRANDNFAYGISFTSSGTDATSIDITGNTITDTTPYQRYAMRFYSFVGSSTVVTIKDNIVRGWITKGIDDAAGFVYQLSGNDIDGTARFASVTAATSATSTVVTTGQVTAKDMPQVIGANVNGVAMAPYVSSVASGTFTVSHSAAGAGAAFRWTLV